MTGVNIMAKMESSAMERKIINITGKRQITIPQKFYERLRFGKEVECVMTDNAIILRPLTSSDDGFTMEILKDLISQGYNGDELLAKFAEQRANINMAISALINEADDIAEGKLKGAATEELFGED